MKITWADITLFAYYSFQSLRNSQELIQRDKRTKARILERGLNLVRPHSRNKSDFTDLIFRRYVLQAIVTS